MGKGRSRTSSMSKTRKMTASRKNRIEKGSRAFVFGSKPHSNGEAFSRSLFIFRGRKSIMVINRATIVSAIEEYRSVIDIVF